MKLRNKVLLAVGVLLVFIGAYSLGIKKGSKTDVRPLESYLIQEVTDPNWINNYGVDLESRLVYNVAMLNRVVNTQGIALKYLLEDPNSRDRITCDR